MSHPSLAASLLMVTSLLSQVTMSCVATALHCCGRVAGLQCLGQTEQAAATVLLRASEPALLLASPVELSRLAQGIGYAGMDLPAEWLKSFEKVGWCV